MAAGFVELVQRWAAPSAVLTAVRDAAAPAGWRIVPSLCAGSLTLGIEKTLARLAEDSPEILARPTVLRGDEVPGIRVRDNVVVPWWCEAGLGAAGAARGPAAVARRARRGVGARRGRRVAAPARLSRDADRDAAARAPGRSRAARGRGRRARSSACRRRHRGRPGRTPPSRRASASSRPSCGRSASSGTRSRAISRA